MPFCEACSVLASESNVTAKADFNPVLLDIPDRLETERLLLRAPQPGDGAVVNASVLETLEDLRRFPASMIWVMEDQPVEKTEEFARRGAAGWLLRADFPMLAFRRDTGEHVLNCGLHRFNWETRVFEIGWWCRKRSQGQGFVTEAARGVTEFAFRHLRHIEERTLRPGRHSQVDACLCTDAVRKSAFRAIRNPSRSAAYGRLRPQTLTGLAGACDFDAFQANSFW